MKAISLWQPWASLMAYGFKTIETRSWATLYRGPLLIHAAKRKMDLIHSKAVADFEAAGIDWVDGLPFGCLVCQVNLYNIVLIKPGYIGREIAHGDFRLGRSAWMTNDLKRFQEPIPYRGRQGLFDVDLPEFSSMSGKVTTQQKLFPVSGGGVR